MAFCAKCGAAMSGAFCPQCGSQAGGAAPSGPPPASSGTGSSGLSENVAAMLCYVTIIPAIAFLVIAPYNKNRTIRFHAFQNIFLCAAVFVLNVALSILMYILARLGLGLLGLLFNFIWLGFLALWIYLLYKTYNGEKVVLPVVGPLAEKQAG